MLELARESDWEEVKRLSVQIHDLHAGWRPDMFYCTEEPYPKEVFLEAIRNRMVYVARIDGIIAAYVVLNILHKSGAGIVERKILMIDKICVEESIRGHGIGKTLVEEIRALARAFGCTQLMLSVHPENDAAVGFYQKCGFRIRTINMDMQL